MALRVQLRAPAAKAASASQRPPVFARPRLLARAASAHGSGPSDPAADGPSRRALMLGVAAGFAFPALVPRDRPARAAQGDVYKTFLGYSQAPDLYMGYGQASDAPALYQFEYPATWTEEPVTKTEKSTMGMDGRVMHPTTRKELAYVVALGGKDYRDSVLKDAKSSLIVFAGSDPDLRQALTDGSIKQEERRVGGVPLYLFDIASDRRHFLSTIGKKGDTVFALVVAAPSSAWDRDAEALQHIQESFRLL